MPMEFISCMINSITVIICHVTRLHCLLITLPTELDLCNGCRGITPIKLVHVMV